MLHKTIDFKNFLIFIIIIYLISNPGFKIQLPSFFCSHILSHPLHREQKRDLSTFYHLQFAKSNHLHPPIPILSLNPNTILDSCVNSQKSSTHVT